MPAVEPEQPSGFMAVPYSDVRAKIPPTPNAFTSAKSVTLLPNSSNASAAQVTRRPVSGTPGDLQRTFAQIVTLLMRTPETQNLSLVDLYWLAVPALRNQQIVIAEGRTKDGKPAGPVGSILWAQVSPAVDRRLMTDRSAVPRLEAADWTSGDIAWVVLGIGRPDVVNAMLGELSKGPLRGRTMKVRSVGPGGVVTVKEVSARAAGP